MGIFMKSMNREGAIAGMLSGMIFTFGYIVYFKLMEPFANVAANWLFGISPEGIGFIGMFLNFGVAIAVAKIATPTPEHIKDLVSNIRLPVGEVKK
jgi:cation/acetate symporter